MQHWTDDAEDRLSEAWDAGKSCTAIGAELGTTKGAVNGKAHRMDLRRRKEPQEPRKLRAPRPPRPLISARADWPATCLLNMKRGACKWPMNAPRRGEWTLFCCEPVEVEGRVYCNAHHDKAFVRSPARRRP